MRRKKSPYKKGVIIEVYRDYQTCKDFEGMGELLELKSQGLPFILRETKKAGDQVVYTYQTWLVDLDGFKTYRKLRYVKGIGNCYLADEVKKKRLDQDVFLRVNGKEIY